MKNKNLIFRYLELIAEHIPANFYCIDLQGRFAVLNERTLSGIGGKTKSEIIGKNVHELYKNKDIAEKLQKDIDKVIATGEPSIVEDKIVDVTTGRIRYFSATRALLQDKEGNNLAVVGTSIETTAEKEAEISKLEVERLKLENEKHEALAKKQEKVQALFDKIFRFQQAAVAEYMDDEIGEEKQINNENIKLTLWETQVLFTMSHKKTAKSAANYLSKRLNKRVSNDAINTILSSALYQKFGVGSIGDLIQKALLLQMIPFTFPEKL